MHLLDARARLMLMGLRHRHRDVSARAARKALGLTDGNLASHAARLEEAGWMTSRRALAPSGFELRYRITPEGSAAFVAHVGELRRLLGEWDPAGSAPAQDGGEGGERKPDGQQPRHGHLEGPASGR